MDDFEAGFGYADASTPLGRLQRGRGLGAREAVGEDVYACVLTDTRSDRQTEERAAYLARAVHRLDLSLGPIERHVFADARDDAEGIEPALDVLALLPLVGRVDAAVVLRRYAVEGRHWAAALAAIDWPRSGAVPAVWAGLDVDVLARRDDAELAEAVDGHWGPWPAWARTRPRIRRLLDRYPQSGIRRSPRPWGGTDSAALLAEITARAGRGPGDVLIELGRRGDLVVLDVAETPSLRNAFGFTPGVVRALGHLGPLAVPRARAWAAGADVALRPLAVEVLAGFGDRTDAPYLLDALTTATAAGEWCGAEKPARGLGRLRIPEAAGVLARAWVATTHSYARAEILMGLLGCCPVREAAEYATEALDDCEARVRRIACAAPVDAPEFRARVADLRADSLASEPAGQAVPSQSVR